MFKFSIIMPTYNMEPRFIRKSLETIKDITFNNFELVLVDDGTTDKDCKHLIYHMAPTVVGCNLRIVTLEKNSGINAATDAGIMAAEGEWVTFCDADDLLAPTCLDELNKVIEQYKDKVDIIYTNQSRIDANGNIISTDKKPDWNRDFFYQNMYINHLTAIRSSIAKEKAASRSKDHGGSQDYDLVLRCLESTDNVVHVPLALYQWRIHNANHQLGTRLFVATEQSKRALREHLERTKQDKLMSIVPTSIPGRYNVERKIINNPKVVIILLTKDRIDLLKQCVDSYQRECRYTNCDLVLMHHFFPREGYPRAQEMHKFIQLLPYEVTEWDEEFNYAEMMNLMMEKYYKQYDYMILLNDDIILTRNAIEELIALASQKEDAGIIGAKLLYPNNPQDGRIAPSWDINSGRLQHAGVRFVRDICANHIYMHKPSNWPAANFVRVEDAVTFALVLIKSKLFEKLKFDEHLKMDFNDIDYCAEAIKHGYKTYYTPWSIAWHYESVTRKPLHMCNVPEDKAHFMNKHKRLLKMSPTMEDINKIVDGGR